MHFNLRRSISIKTEEIKNDHVMPKKYRNLRNRSNSTSVSCGGKIIKQKY